MLCTVFALVFRLKTVDIEFRSRAINTNLSEDTPTRVLETGDFDIGKNIVFMNFDDNIQKIEKNNPFVKVEQVIRYFPNIVRVYISEREPKYRVKDSGQSSNSWYILDNDFKILDKVSEGELTTKSISGNSNYYDQTIEITKETLTLKSSAIVGEFVTDDIQNYLLSITSGIYGKTKDFTTIRKIDYAKTTQTFSITMRNESLENAEGCKIVITGTDSLYEKALAGAVAFKEGQIIDNVSQRIENTPDIEIKILKDASGNFYGVA